MDAGDLEIGFRLGDWVFEPRQGRISGNGRSHALAFHHVRIIKLLAERHGEVVERALKLGYSRRLLEADPVLKSLLPSKKA